MARRTPNKPLFIGHDEAPVEVAYFVSFCAEGLDDVLQASFQVEVSATENIHRGILVFGPSVDGQVAFSNNHDARYTVWAKGMKVAADDGSLHDFGRSTQDALCGCGGSDLTDRALVQLEVYVTPQSLRTRGQDGGMMRTVFDSEGCLSGG